jgi:hypothetical protein
MKGSIASLWAVHSGDPILLELTVPIVHAGRKVRRLLLPYAEGRHTSRFRP